jgi:hypothetical protein
MNANSEDRFQRAALALLASAGGRELRPELLGEAKTVLDELHRARIDSLYYLASDTTAVEQRIYDKIGRAQRDAAAHLLGEFDREETPCVLFKGTELNARYFEGHAMHLSLDVDLLVARHDVQIAKKVLYGAGYRQGDVDPETLQLNDADVVEVAALEHEHYELFPFKKVIDIQVDPEEAACVRSLKKRIVWMSEERCRVLLEVDVHHNVAVNVEPEPLFERAVPSALGAGLTLSAADHLWFTASRYYTEVAVHGKDHLRDFAFLVAHLARSIVDWDVVLAAATQYENRPALYYYLTFVDSLAGRRIPGEVLRELEPLRGPRSKDYGWQLAKLFRVMDPSPLASLIESI